MIPTQQMSDLTITDLPIRANNVSTKDTLNLLGGKSQTWKCFRPGRREVIVGLIWTTYEFQDADALRACDYWYPECRGGICRAIEIFR